MVNNNSALGPVPSRYEVDKAIASLLGFWNGISSERMDALVGSVPRVLISTGLERLEHALRLLQTEPVVKMLVISLVTDKAFWDAVLNNKAVRKVQESLITDGRLQISGDVDLTSNILSWFLEKLKDTIMDLIDKFKLLVMEMIQTCTATTTTTTTSENKAQLEEKVGSSFLLSVVILFIVVLARMTSP